MMSRTVAVAGVTDMHYTTNHHEEHGGIGPDVLPQGCHVF